MLLFDPLCRCEAPPGTAHADYLRYWIYVLENATAIANQPGGARAASGQLSSGKEAQRQ